jgi:hypothetical protein
VEAIGDGCGACDIRRDLRLYLILCTRYLTGNSDWMTEEGLLFDVMLVSFPSPAVLVAVIVLTSAVLEKVGIGLPMPRRPELIIEWFLFAAVGYWQWFVLLPKLIQLKWKSRSMAKDL